MKVDKIYFLFLLWTFQVPVYDLVLVEIVHAGGDLLGPLHHLPGRHVLAVPEHGEERAVRAVLHHDAEHRRLDAHAAELHDVRVVELAQVPDVRLELLLHLLDGHLLGAEGAREHGALGPGPQPAQVLDLLEGDLPVIRCNTKFPMKTWKREIPFLATRDTAACEWNGV